MLRASSTFCNYSVKKSDLEDTWTFIQRMFANHFISHFHQELVLGFIVERMYSSAIRCWQLSPHLRPSTKMMPLSSISRSFRYDDASLLSFENKERKDSSDTARIMKSDGMKGIFTALARCCISTVVIIAIPDELRTWPDRPDIRSSSYVSHYYILLWPHLVFFWLYTARYWITISNFVDRSPYRSNCYG